MSWWLASHSFTIRPPSMGSASPTYFTVGARDLPSLNAEMGGVLYLDPVHKAEKVNRFST